MGLSCQEYTQCAFQKLNYLIMIGYVNLCKLKTVSQSILTCYDTRKYLLNFKCVTFKLPLGLVIKLVHHLHSTELHPELWIQSDL